MIGRLRGVLALKHPPHLTIDVGGVGYDLEASLSTFERLPEVGAEITLHTHLAVREDAHVLYGFASLDERTLFRSLIRVSGVGAKLALLILSGMDVNTFSRCVQEGDTAALTRLPGIGKKTAERLIVDMRDRLGTLELGAPFTPAGTAAGSGEAGAVADAVSALVALGYKPVDATRMVRALDSEGVGSEELIRQALQATVRR